MLRDYATKGTCIWPQPPPIKVRNQRQGLKKTERKAKASTPHLRRALEQQQQAEHDDAVFAVEDVVDAERAGYDRAWRGTYGRLIQERMAASFAPLPQLTRSAVRACQHAHLGKPETAHGPTLEYRQLPHGSSSHSQQWVWSHTHIVPHPQHHLQRPHHVHIGSTRTCSSSTPLAASSRRKII